MSAYIIVQVLEVDGKWRMVEQLPFARARSCLQRIEYVKGNDKMRVRVAEGMGYVPHGNWLDHWRDVTPKDIAYFERAAKRQRRKKKARNQPPT